MTGSYPKIEVLTGPERRRRWSVAEKLEIVAQTRGKRCSDRTFFAAG